MPVTKMPIWPHHFPQWDDLRRHLVAEFLPGSHADKLDEMFNNHKQRTSLNQYEVSTRNLMNAMIH